LEIVSQLRKNLFFHFRHPEKEKGAVEKRLPSKGEVVCFGSGFCWSAVVVRVETATNKDRRAGLGRH